MKKHFGKRLLSLILCLAIVASFIPANILNTAIADTDGGYFPNTLRLADPSALDQWKLYFGSMDGHAQNVDLTTEFAGGVWTDKSVFTPDDIPAQLTDAKYNDESISMTDKGDNFLVALSAIASNKQIKGYSTIPTDTVFILDLSSSMRSTGQGGTSAVDELVASTNSAIGDLLALNANNRVAVIVYSGNVNKNFNGAADGNTAIIMPLDSYTPAANGKFLESVRDGNNTADRALQVVNGVTNSKGAAVHSNTYYETATGTFLQDGIYEAMRVLLAADTTINAGFQAGSNRIPIMVLMSDGEPTMGNNTYYGNTDLSGLGNCTMYSYNGNTNNISHRNTIAFVTSLTAAFAKKTVTAHYNEPMLLYTLAFGNTVLTRDEAMSVLNPKNASTTQNNFWQNFLNGQRQAVFTTGSGRNQQVLYTQNSTDPRFALTADDRYYVDGYYQITEGDDMNQAFRDIVSEIELQSKYYPTFVEKDHNHDGYLTFADKIGSYMEVSNVKGIVIGDRLFSGKDLASSFTQNGLGSLTDPTAFGYILLDSIHERIGTPDTDTALALVNHAFKEKQLYYNAQTGEYSNYIGWFSDAEGNFIDPWNENMDPATYPAGATHIIRSYGYLGDTDVIPGFANTNMMYMSVRVATEITTGETILTWQIPASLVPTVSYEVDVSIDENGNFVELLGLDLASNSAQNPIRLLYEVELRRDIQDWNVAEKTNGTTTFYTNKWSTDPSDTTLNTYSHFEPSVQNERYYYTHDTLVYTDTNKTLYSGASKPSGSGYYRHFQVFEKLENGQLRVHDHFEPISAEALASAVQVENSSSWVVPKDTVHRYYDFEISEKPQNTTGTMAYNDHPFVETRNGYYFTYSTQGNNGKLTVAPATGLKVTKTLTEKVDGSNTTFTFTLSGNISGAQLIRLDKDGNEASRSALPVSGQFTLNADETVYIVGLSAGNYTVTEEKHGDYAVSSVTVDGTAQSGNAANITVTAQQINDVHFTNTPKGYGNLMITKEVTHNQYGHTVPDSVLTQDFTFTVNVGPALAGQQLDTLLGQTAGKVTVGANGTFTITLKHGQTMSILNLPDGTQATVTEQTSGLPAYFVYDHTLTRDYSTAPQDQDNLVTIHTNENSTAIIHNSYKPVQTTASLDVKIQKDFIIESPLNATFTFKLQQYVNDSWVDMDTASISYSGDQGVKSIDLLDVLAGITYTEAGEYSYQIFEVIPDNKIPGIAYDRTVHTFTVLVTDNGGQLSATVMSDGNPVGSTFEARFENVYHVAPVSLNIQKFTVNTSGNTEPPKAGFIYGFYKADANWAITDQTPFTTIKTDATGLAHFSTTYNQAGTYRYIINEINDGREHVTYSTAVYNIAVTVTLSDDNKLVLTVTNNSVAVEQVVTAFENTYAPPATPQTGDNMHLVLWFSLLGISGMAMAAALIFRKKILN